MLVYRLKIGSEERLFEQYVRTLVKSGLGLEAFFYFLPLGEGILIRKATTTCSHGNSVAGAWGGRRPRT